MKRLLHLSRSQSRTFASKTGSLALRRQVYLYFWVLTFIPYFLFFFFFPFHSQLISLMFIQLPLHFRYSLSRSVHQGWCALCTRTNIKNASNEKAVLMKEPSSLQSDPPINKKCFVNPSTTTSLIPPSLFVVCYPHSHPPHTLLQAFLFIITPLTTPALPFSNKSEVTNTNHY